MPITNVIKEGSPLVTHIGMFLSTLTSLGTAEQQAEWSERASKNKILGTYVQTELGHGTFVRGLETTSTYDPIAKEFVINTPTIRATKVSEQIIVFHSQKILKVLLVVARRTRTHCQSCGCVCATLFSWQESWDSTVYCSTERS